MKFLNAKGQSTVEYILLLAVVMSLTLAVFNSQAFKDFVGPESAFMKKLYSQAAYSYRHGREGTVDSSDYERSHETYFNADEGRSRFFAPLGKYPE